MFKCEICDKEFEDKNAYAGHRSHCIGSRPVIYKKPCSPKREWTAELLQEVVSRCESKIQVIRELGGDYRGGYYQQLNKHLKRFSIDTSHFTGSAHLKGKTHNWPPKTPLEDVLVEHSTVGSSNLRRRLVKEGILENKCSICGNTGEWNGEPLTLQLDHINGEHSDNRLSNLQILCPNCHSQTDTFAGRRHKRHKKPTSPQTSRPPKEPKAKVPRPTKMPPKEELEGLIWEIPTTLIAKRYGVSGKAVEKWCKKLEIPKPPRGYWAKQKVK